MILLIFTYCFQQFLLSIRSDELRDILSYPDSSDQFQQEIHPRRVDNFTDWFQSFGVFNLFLKVPDARERCFKLLIVLNHYRFFTLSLQRSDMSVENDGSPTPAPAKRYVTNPINLQTLLMSCALPQILVELDSRFRCLSFSLISNNSDLHQK